MNLFSVKTNYRFTQNSSFLQKQIEKENKRFKQTSSVGGDMSFEEVSMLNLPFILLNNINFVTII